MSILNQLLTEFNNNRIQQFKPEDVHNKLSSFENQNNTNNPKDTVTFGLEDTNGDTIKVHIKSDQAKEFETTLNQLFSEYDPTDPYSPEISEILFQIKDRFNIVNIEWPKFSEDEEVAPPMDGDEMSQVDDLKNTQPTEDVSSIPDSGGSEKELFNSLLQTMMADAEAKRQEALAKAAEARAREAEAAARMADNKLKAEEEVADMEAFYDVQNAEKKEAKKLAKLAKYRHTVKQQDDDEGKFDQADDAITSQDSMGSGRMDQPSGENPPGTEPGQPPVDMNNIDNEDPVIPQGMENEESIDPTISAKQAINQTDQLLRVLYNLRSRNQ